SLDAAVFCVGATTALADRVGGIFGGAGPSRGEAGVSHFDAPGGGTIAVADPVAFAALYEDEPPATRDGIAAVQLGVEDVARSFDLIQAAGFTTHRGVRPDSFWVGAAEAGGVVLEFVQAPR